MDSNIDFLRKFVNNHILRLLTQRDTTLTAIGRSILDKTDNAFSLGEQALASLLKQLLDEGLIISDGDMLNPDTAFTITAAGKKLIADSVPSWELSRGLLERVFSSYQRYTPETVEDAMYARTGVALIENDGIVCIEFYFNDVFKYKPANTYVQLTIDTEREYRKAEAREKLGISSRPQCEDSSLVAHGAREHDVDIENKGQPNAAETAASETIASAKRTLEDFIRVNEGKNTDSPYRATLDAMFGSRNDNAVSEAIIPATSTEATIATSGYADLKERMLRVGYKLKPYVKQAASSYYSMNFIYSSKIKRDCYTFLYFAMLIEIFAGYFAFDRFAGIGFIPYVATAAALFVLPAYAWIAYLIKPDRRIRAQFDFRITVAGSLMLYINLLVITILLGFFAFKSDIYSAKSMVVPIFYPAAFLLNLPLGVVIYNGLYRSYKYHLR